MASKRLGIYLNDHLAGATFGVNLGRRCQRANEGTPLGGFLEDLVDEIEVDRTTLLRVMKRLDIRPARAKIATAWGAERLGRLKPNGQVRGYSPLSRLLELEGLGVGIEGKRSLWLTLASSVRAAELDPLQFEELATRARDQRERLEPYRVAAAELLA